MEKFNFVDFSTPKNAKKNLYFAQCKRVKLAILPVFERPKFLFLLKLDLQNHQHLQFEVGY